ncbi:MAG TPA: hypothetical protein VL625_05940 [Patescibacteria group bacterium]|nr:hypothetical protein [Patescibacteria group bacterium]
MNSRTSTRLFAIAAALVVGVIDPCVGQTLPVSDSADGNARQMVEDGQATEPDDQGSIIIDRDRAADANAAPTEVQQGTAGTAVVGPGVFVAPDQAAPGFPDYPLDSAPAEPMTVSFIFEHRTALNEKHVTVRGTIVSTLLADKACPPDRGMCAQPRIVLGDPGGSDKYRLEVLLPEDDKTTYADGQTVEISGIASSGPAAVVIRKE